MFEIVKEILKACETGSNYQLEYTEPEVMSFLIRDLGQGKIVYVNNSYRDAARDAEYKCFGIYAGCVLYITDSYNCDKTEPELRTVSYDNRDELYEQEFQGSVKPYSKATEMITESIKACLRKLNAKREMPIVLTTVDGVKDMAEKIAWEIALNGESDHDSEYTINKFEPTTLEVEAILLGTGATTMSEVANNYYYKGSNANNIFREYLADIHAKTIDYSKNGNIKMYRAIKNMGCSTVNCQFEKAGAVEEVKLNADPLLYCIERRTDLNWSAFMTNEQRKHIEETFGDGAYQHIYPDYITKVTYSRKVIFERTAA